MSKTVTIPVGNEPFHCVINGVHYYYTSGSTVSVPDEVAALIQANAGNREEPENKSDIAIPRDGNTNDVLTRTATGAEWKAPATPTPELPSVSGSDNGKVLKVVEGAWAAASGGGGLETLRITFGEEHADTTWQQAYDALAAGKFVYTINATEGDALLIHWYQAAIDNGTHVVMGTKESTALAETANGYLFYD